MDVKRLWSQSVHQALFGNNGKAPFRPFGLEYDEFVLFYSKFLKSGPAQGLLNPNQELELVKKALGFYVDFQSKRMEKLKSKIKSDRESLPIHKYQDQIIETIQQNRVVLIAADTGAGKSTQVPQYLLESGFSRIACTQPRRIACFSLAKRVKYESLNIYGSTIGYKVRFDKNTTQDTKLVFLTEGVLIRQYASDPSLSQYDVIIIDEVHERHVNSDFLLGILKRVLEMRSDLKLVLMSATVNAELFSGFFNAPVIKIPGRLYPVEIEYIAGDEPDRLLVDKGHVIHRAKAIIKESVPSRGKIKPKQYTKVLEMIDESVPGDERGDLLIFVSGIQEITSLKDELVDYAEYTRFNN